MGQSNYVHLDDCVVLRATEKAILVRYDDEEIWLPKSQIVDPADPDTIQAGSEERTISITEWLAKQKGIETE